MHLNDVPRSPLADVGAIPTRAYAITGLALAWVAIAVLVYSAIRDPRGVLRRGSAAYVVNLDIKLRSMFLPPRGYSIGVGQVAVAATLVACYVFVPSDALLWGTFVAITAPPLVVRLLLHRRQRRLDDQVHGFALALANGLKTTASVGDALWVTVSVTTKPLREELETALKQTRVGSTIEEALLAMAERAQSRALDVVVSALLIGRQTGGDLPRILEGTAGSLREMKRLEEMTATVTSGAKLSLAIAAVTTAGMAIGLPRFLPGFFDPLRDTVKGQVVVAQCVIVYFLALYLGYRFTRSDV